MENILKNLIIKDFYSATTMHTKSNTKDTRINRNCWAIILKYEGETVYTCNNERYVSNADKPIVLPKGSSYSWVSNGDGDFISIEFDAELTYNGIFSFNYSGSSNLLNLFKKIEYRSFSPDSTTKLKNIRDIYDIIIKLIAAQKKNYIPTDKSSKLNPAMEYISQNFNSKIANDFLASLCGISTVYFRKLFTEVHNASPGEYIKMLRIKKAKEMLKSDFGSISDIAATLGYMSIYDFSRDFKKQVGLSPSKYIARHKSGV